MNPIITFFFENTPPWRVIFTAGPMGLAWAALCLTAAGLAKRRLGLATGYSRKIFHFLIFTSVAIIAWRWGTPAVCLFGGMTSLVVLYAVARGAGHLWYEAMAREKDAPHRTYFVLAPYAATLFGGLAANILFGPSAMAGYLVTGFGDAIGEPVGTRFGRHPYRVPSAWGVPATRTLEGSAAVALASALAIAAGIALSPVLACSPACLWKLPLFALVCAALESCSPHGWDNAVLQVVPTALAFIWFGVTL